MSSSYNFFDPDQPVEEYDGCLPHWRQEGAIYFVTFRTADSLPAEKVRLWKHERDDWLGRNPPPHTVGQREEYFRLFPARLFTCSRADRPRLPGKLGEWPRASASS